MATTWAGWTAATIKGVLVETFGTGWQNDTTKSAVVDSLIYAAWCLVKVLTATASTITADTHPTFVNQCWFFVSLWFASNAIAPESQQAAMWYETAQQMLDSIKRDRGASEGTHTYATA